MQINPIELKNGNWDRGYALDIYRTSPKNHVNEDERRTYEEFTTLGFSLHKYKYWSNYDLELTKIINLSKPFLYEWSDLNLVDYIIPVPPSKKDRAYQPTIEITRKIAQILNKQFIPNLLVNTSSIVAKNGEKNLNDIKFCNNNKPKYKGHILLVDDLFKTGNTLKRCVTLIKENNVNYQIFVLAIAKTKNWNNYDDDTLTNLLRIM